MKKAMLFFSVILIAATSIVSVAFAQSDNGEQVLIYPWQIEPDENGNRIVAVTSDQIILLGARWGACTRGLAQGWAATADVAYAVDGQSIFLNEKESRDYWSRPVLGDFIGENRCVNPTDTLWFVDWSFELGKLSPGDYSVGFDYWNDHKFPDGGDYDGDGRPDLFEFARSIDFTIHVEN